MARRVTCVHVLHGQAGTVLRSQIYGGACGATYEAGWNLQSTSDGGFIIAGTGAGKASSYKADEDGNLGWPACDFSGQVRDIDATDDGGFIVTGLLSGTDGDASSSADLAQSPILEAGDAADMGDGVPAGGARRVVGADGSERR